MLFSSRAKQEVMTRRPLQIFYLYTKYFCLTVSSSPILPPRGTSWSEVNRLTPIIASKHACTRRSFSAKEKTKSKFSSVWLHPFLQWFYVRLCSVIDLGYGIYFALSCHCFFLPFCFPFLFYFLSLLLFRIFVLLIINKLKPNFFHFSISFFLLI